jgi:archaellum biogenesis ATPase FlaH
MNIKKEIEENQIIVVIIPNELYLKKLIFLIKLLIENGEILYVNINKPYSSLIEVFRKKGIPVDRFFFIDTVTKTVVEPEPVENVEFVSSPSALTELSIAISKMLRNKKFYCVLFDSLSTLLVYEGSLTVIKFTHSLMSKFRALNSKGVFTVLKGDIKTELIKDLNMFADRIIDLNEG